MVNAERCVTPENDDCIHRRFAYKIVNESSGSEGPIHTSSRKSFMLKQAPAVLETAVISCKLNLCGRDWVQATVYDKATWNLRERADTPSTQRHKIHQRTRKCARSDEERRRFRTASATGHLAYIAVGFAIDNDRRDCP